MDRTCQKKTSQFTRSFSDGLSFAKMLTAKLVSVCRTSTRFNNFQIVSNHKNTTLNFSARREYLCAWSSREARPPWLAWGPLKQISLFEKPQQRRSWSFVINSTIQNKRFGDQLLTLGRTALAGMTSDGVHCRFWLFDNFNFTFNCYRLRCGPVNNIVMAVSYDHLELNSRDI